jgi:N-acetylneuraminic acid mutarotase
MAHAGAAQFNGKLYVVGGRTESSDSSSSWINLNTNEMYDPISDTWTSKAPMPTDRSGLTAAASADGNIYVIGGDNVFSFTVFDSNEKYDPKTDKWSPEAPMPTARHGPAGVFDNMSKRIYVKGGGMEPACSASNINEAFLAAKR